MGEKGISIFRWEDFRIGVEDEEIGKKGDFFLLFDKRDFYKRVG